MNLYTAGLTSALYYEGMGADGEGAAVCDAPQLGIAES